jgi:hypothetical protein
VGSPDEEPDERVEIQEGDHPHEDGERAGVEASSEEGSAEKSQRAT